MLGKFIVAAMVLSVMCCTGYADVMYLRYGENEDSIYRITADS